MKKIIDPFSYSVGHGFAGLMCQLCHYYNNGNCSRHNLILSVLQDESRFASGEWFCKNFKNSDAHEIGIREFKSIQNELENGVLYKACQQEYLNMIQFNELEKLK